MGEPPLLPLFGTTDLEFDVLRHEAFEGPVRVSLEFLPEGVEAEPVELAPGEDSGTIRLVSDRTTRKLGTRGFHVVVEVEGESRRQLESMRIVAVVTELTDNGPGSLRHYLELAPEFELAEGERLEIRFDPGSKKPAVIPLDSPLIARTDLAIVGPTRDGEPLVSLDGQERSLLLVVDEGVRVEVKGLGFHRGKADQGGAILNRGELSVQSAVFEGNLADDGGAIFTEGGRLEVHEVRFRGNEATDGGAVLVSDGSFLGSAETSPWGTVGGSVSGRAIPRRTSSTAPSRATSPWAWEAPSTARGPRNFGSSRAR